jgi:hypothetical protein
MAHHLCRDLVATPFTESCCGAIVVVQRAAPGAGAAGLEADDFADLLALNNLGAQRRKPRLSAIRAAVGAPTSIVSLRNLGRSAPSMEAFTNRTRNEGYYAEQREKETRIFHSG